MDLSVIIPVYNGANTISKLVEVLHQDLTSFVFEIILVNDGSSDDSEEICDRLASDYQNVSFISLRKNFGEFNAVICGLNHTRGKYSVIIDDDFQNPPSEIIKLYQEAERTNLDVIYSYYGKKNHSFFRNFGSWLINRLTTNLLKKPSDLYLSSFKLIKKEVVQEICRYKGPFPYIDGLIFRTTHAIGKVQVVHQARNEGKSNYTFGKLINLTMTILFGYSLIPARIVLFSGFFSILVSLIGLFLKIFTFHFLPNFIRISFVLGVILLALGIVGEYVARTFLVISDTPQFTVKYKKNSNVSE